MSPKSQKMERKLGRNFLFQRPVKLVTVFSNIWDTYYLCFIVTNRKNWTSSWTVLQGSSLLFAKGQGGSTSWVGISSAPRGSCFCKFSGFHSSLCYFSPPYFCIVTCLHCQLCCEVCHPLFIAPLPPLLSSFPPWSLTTTAAPSQSCSSLSLATGSAQSSPVLLSPMWTIGLCRLPLYVPSLCMCCCFCLSFILSFKPSLTDPETDVYVCMWSSILADTTGKTLKAALINILNYYVQCD